MAASLPCKRSAKAARTERSASDVRRIWQLAPSGEIKLAANRQTNAAPRKAKAVSAVQPKATAGVTNMRAIAATGETPKATAGVTNMRTIAATGETLKVMAGVTTALTIAATGVRPIGRGDGTTAITIVATGIVTPVTARGARTDTGTRIAITFSIIRATARSAG